MKFLSLLSGSKNTSSKSAPEPPPVQRSIDGSSILFRWLKNDRQIRTVIDIGAADGEFLAFLWRFFKAECAHAFEPLPSSCATISAREIPNLTIHQMALSDEPGEATFDVNAFAPASSILPISEVHRREYPQTKDIAERIVVPVKRLDDIIDVSTLPKGIFVKMDVQGAEDNVIRGGRAVISAADFVLAEVSFVEMYEGQGLFEEVHNELAALDFRLAGLKNQLSAESGRPLFAHVLYRKIAAGERPVSR